MCNVKQCCIFPAVDARVHDAVFVLDWHGPSSERYHFACMTALFCGDERLTSADTLLDLSPVTVKSVSRRTSVFDMKVMQRGLEQVCIVGKASCGTCSDCSVARGHCRSTSAEQRLLGGGKSWQKLGKAGRHRCSSVVCSRVTVGTAQRVCR